MAEAAAPVPVAPVPQVAAGGRGRGKGKKKAKKGKKKFARAAPAEGAEPKPKKEPKVSLKTQVEQEIGDRNIEEVIKEAKAKVDELQTGVTKAQQEQVDFETSLETGKSKMQESSHAVDQLVLQETIALEKLKAARRELLEAQKKVAEKRLELGDGDRALQVLSEEGDLQEKSAELARQKQEVIAAKEAARKALMEANLKDQQIKQAMKEKRGALAITDDPAAAEKAKVEAERAAEEEKQRKEAKAAGAHAEKDLKAELKQLEKARAERDKERAKAFKAAAGLGKQKRALADGSAASPAKAAKIQDVD